MSLPKLFITTLLVALFLIGSGIVFKKCTRHSALEIPQLPPQEATTPVAYSPALTLEISVEPEVGPLLTPSSNTHEIATSAVVEDAAFARTPYRK